MELDTRMTDFWPRSLRRVSTVEVAVVGGILAAVAVAGASLIAHGIPLGWDESVYASRSRSLVTDIPAAVWKDYRPPGLPIVGLLGGAFGFTDTSLRAMSLAMSLMTLTTVWALTRLVWGPFAGIIALLTLVGAPVVLDALVLFQTDLPAAGLLLALMVVLWHEFEHRPAPTSLLLAAAPLVAAAFYIRYGTLIAIAGIGLAAVLLWHRSMIRHARLVGVTVAFAAVLVAPHVIEAVIQTGSPIGILTSASDQVNTAGPLDTASRYLGWLPAQLAHRLGFLVMLAGLGHGAFVALEAVRRRTLTAAARRSVFLVVPAGITVTGLVLTSHPEPRYVLFPVILAIVAGAGAVSSAIGWLRPRAAFKSRQRALDVAVVGAIVLTAVVVASVGTRRIDALERDGDETRWWADIGSSIRGDAGGPCTVATTLAPVVGWYSGCEGIPFTPGAATHLVSDANADRAYVVFTAIDDRRATAAAIAEYRALVEGGAATDILLSDATTEVFRLGP